MFPSFTRACQKKQCRDIGQTVMSYTNFGRGRGFGPRGSRATASSFSRPRFPPPPFRHVGPPRPGRPFMPWQPNNMFFQPHLLRGNPQFRPGSRRKNFCGYNARLPAPNRLPVPLEYEDVSPDLNSLQIENNQTEATPQIPLPGSEEERQQKIMETADRLKQKLSCFSSSEMRNIWSYDKPFSSNVAEDDCTNNTNIATLRYQQVEHNLISNDLTDIEKINPDDSRLDNTQYISNDTTNDMVMLEENENESQLTTIPNNQMTNLSVENEYLEMDNWLHESVDNLEQPDLHKDNNVESGLLDSDLQCEFNIPVNISQDCCDQQQDIPQGNEIYPISATIEQDVSKTSSLQDIPFPTDLTHQDVLQKDASQSEQELVTTNLEVQENILESQVPTISSNSNSCTLSQSTVANALVLNNITSDNQVPKVKKNSFHNGPPKLSPHTEQGELPVDFDPSTPPPILVKQDEPRVMPLPPVSDVLPLFNPTEPPPNIRHLLTSTSKGKEIPMWNNINVKNSAPTTYNREMHTELNTNGGFISQQLPLESQSNVFLPPHIDTIQFSSLFSVPPGNHSVINPNVPSHAIFPTHAMSHNSYASSSPSSELLPPSDCNISKDDGLNDMQEALKFAKQMTNITEKREKESSSKSLCESSTTVNSISNVEFISLPPGEPKAKINTKKTKRNDIHSKKISQEQKVSDHLPLEETVIQDMRSVDMSLVNEQERPKVVFNLNNKTKIINTRAGWRENTEKKNGIMQFMESEKMPSISKKNFEGTLRRNEERKNLKKNENNSGNIASSDSIANQNIVSLKKVQKKVNVEKSHANISLLSKTNMQKSMSYVEKNENFTPETSWKNKIISRFLKMSKNEIFNMVNNTTLRKFDVLMKRLVKERKASLSLEMRHAEDEKMKLYDQQQFIKQLNAMLDTDATVSVTDLPTEFIHHLNEVLQLDVQQDNHVEPATTATSNSQNSHLEDANHVFNPVTLFISECPNRTTHINQECERNKSHMIKTGHDRDAQMHHISRSDFNLKDDACNTIVSNKSSINSKLSALQHDLDDIFSEVTKKNQTPAAVKERKYCNVSQRNTKKFDDDTITRSVENDTPLEDDRMHKSESCTRWIERCDRWKRKEREDPYAYRNLTKEEWEAKYGTQANSISSSSFTKKINTSYKNPSHRGRKKSYPRRRHSSESSKHTRTTRHRTLEKDKHKKSRRHSDDRRHSAGYSEYNNDRNDDNTSNCSNNSNSSSSTSNSTSSSSSSSSSNDSNGNTEPNVTKLLRAIKEKEKVAKKMSLNETIRDEVNAEIERERKQKLRKSRKYKKWRKEKKLHHKKKKKKQEQSKKTTNPFDSFSDEDDNEEIAKLLTENEIKKEIVENEITQEVIVKEELDISQEENTRDAEFANASSHVVVENKTICSLPESNNKREKLESALLTAQETPLTTVNQPYAEDRPPTASPTQLKTKAQLKQMPEAADTSDNKIFLKIFTTLPEDWNTINPTECSENLNKSYQATDVNCNRDETEVPAIDNCEHLRESSNENAIPQQSDVCTSSDSFINAKIKGNTNILTSANVSDKATTIVASTSAISLDLPINISRKSRRACKKIDIKTYYERTIQRRMNEQEESKKSAENLTMSTQDLSSTPKIVKPEIPINKSTSILTYDGSIQDPRLFSAARLAGCCQTNSKDNEIALRNDVQQEEKQIIKTSKIAKIALKPVEENLNRVIDTDSTVEKINQDTSKDKHPFIANTNVNVLSNVTTNTISSKSNTGNVIDKKLQNRSPSDSKKFKNIRSEGSKELKLKKEITKIRKTKKKSGITLKSINILSTKIYPLEKTTENASEMIQEKKIDNASDMNKIKIEQTTNPCESKVNNNYNNNAEMKVSIIFSENTDNNNELSQSVDKAKESFSSLEFIGEENTGNDVGNIESTDLPETMRNEEAHKMESANNAASIEVTNKEEQNTREIFNIVSKSDVSAASIKISNDIVKEVVTEDISTSDEQFNATSDATEFLDQIQVEKSNNRDLSESTDNPVFGDTIEKGDMSSNPELDTTSRPDIDDTQKDQPLINANVVNDIEINDKENNAESIVMDSTCKSVNEDNSLPRKTAELSSASNTGNGVISPESVGSPFKGFLPETMIDFEQPNLFNLELHEKDKLFLNDCNVNPATREEETKIVKQQNYESSECNYADNMSMNENFNVTFDDTLLASDKERATNDKSGLTEDENRQGQIVEKSSCEIVTPTLHEDDNIDTGEADEADKCLISESQLTIKESMFINEEEMIQDENGSKDLTSKLTTTIDPSLSDALDDAAISDDALRLAENQSAEHLNNHNMYLETNISTEKISCDKLPGFDSDEHLDNDMFYLDDHLQSAATFDNKDETSFSIHQETSPQYDIIPPTVTPEPTMITSCADLSHDELQEERYKFDLKHISSTDNSDLLTRVPSVEHSPIVIDTPPRTLNIPTKAALKEAATSHFLKSPNNSIKETTQGILEKTQQSKTESASYQTPTWHVDIYQSTKTHSLDTHTNNSVNVNTISSTQNNPHDERVHTNIDVDQSKTSRTSSNNEKCLHSSDIQHNPVVELRKMKELDRMMNEKKTQEKTRDDVYKDRRKRNGTILHKLKGKRQMKYRSERINPIRNSLTRKLKSMKHFTGTINSKEAILARMLEIDIEMHKLTTEKLKLHEMLQNNVENTVTNNEATRENDTISDQIRIVSTLTSQSPRDAKINRAKQKKQHSSSSKQPPIKRKKTVSRSSEDDETTRYMQKKMPVIRWKKTPRLEHTINRREEDLKEKNDLDKTTEQTFANKEVDISSVLDTSKNATIQKSESNTPEDATIRKPESNAFEDAAIQKLQSNATIDHDTHDHDVQVQETAMEKHEKANCDVIDESVKPTIDRSSLDKNADNHTEDSTEREHAECFDIDKRNDISVPSKTANSQPASVQLRGTPESLSIYSDDSTWDFFVQNTTSEMQENRNVTGLVLLDEKLKKEQARTRKLKAIVRKKKKEQLNNYLKRVNNLTMEEEELPLSKLYIRKLRQKRDLLDSLTQRKEDANVDVDPEVLKNVEEVINAVAENRVEDLYEPQTRNVSDIPTTSNLLSQPEEHQFYVDAEAANSDWPCREKKDIEETTEQQQDSNNAPTGDESNHVFKVVNQNKTPFYDEHNVEPDSSVTPEETLIASHSLDCERVPPKDNVVLRNFDIKVSVPKVLIKDDFSLGLLQKFKDTESGIVGTGLVDSTTNMLATNAEKSNEKYDKDISLTAKSIQVVEEDKRKEESETNLIEEKDKQAVDVSNRQNKACELQKYETINNVKDTQNAPQSNTTKSKYSDTIENEDTGDSVASNNKVTMTNVTRDSSVSDSIVEKVNERQKKSDNESEQLSCDAIALKQDYQDTKTYQDTKNANAKENEKSDNPESGSRVFETILDNDQNTRSSVSIDRASEKSEESTDTSVDQRSSLERTTTSVFSFDKITTKSMETNKARSRRKSSISTPVRRSARYTNENVKPNKMNEVEMSSNSNSSEQSSAHEKDLITQCRSKSPTTMRDEKILNNIKRNRVAQKTQTIANRKVSSIDEIKIENQVKSHLSAEPTSSKNKTTINAKKRKHTESQMMNCKVKLIDCKHTLLKQNVNSEILDRLGIIAINPYVSTDISYMQRAISNQDMAVIPATISEQNSYVLSEISCDKKNTDIEILEEKSIKKNNDDDPARETASMEVGELEEAMKTQYTVHKGPILDIKVYI